MLEEHDGSTHKRRNSLSGERRRSSGRPVQRRRALTDVPCPDPSEAPPPPTSTYPPIRTTGSMPLFT